MAEREEINFEQELFGDKAFTEADPQLKFRLAALRLEHEAEIFARKDHSEIEAERVRLLVEKLPGLFADYIAHEPPQPLTPGTEIHLEMQS